MCSTCGVDHAQVQAHSQCGGHGAWQARHWLLHSCAAARLGRNHAGRMSGVHGMGRMECACTAPNLAVRLHGAAAMGPGLTCMLVVLHACRVSGAWAPHGGACQPLHPHPRNTLRPPVLQQLPHQLQAKPPGGTCHNPHFRGCWRASGCHGRSCPGLMPGGPSASALLLVELGRACSRRPVTQEAGFREGAGGADHEGVLGFWPAALPASTKWPVTLSAQGPGAFTL